MARGLGGLLRALWHAVLRFLKYRRRGRPAGAPAPPPPRGWFGRLMWAFGFEPVQDWHAVEVPPPQLYEPVQRVHPVPAVALRLQKAAAGAFFAELGIEYLPGVLVEHLRQYDVSFALWSFCEEFHLQFHALAAPDAQDHAQHRARLRQVVGILIDAELAVRYTPLSGEPVVEALRRSPREAEALIDRLRHAVAVWGDLQAKTVEWPRFVQFRDVAAAK